MNVVKVAEPAAEAARLRRSNAISDALMEQARTVMRDVAQRGDRALFDYTEKFDGVRLAAAKVTEQEFKDAYSKTTKEQVKALKMMKARLEKSEVALLKRLRNIVVRSGRWQASAATSPAARRATQARW
jgi:histidinol dehydrogenase